MEKQISGVKIVTDGRGVITDNQISVIKKVIHLITEHFDIKESELEIRAVSERNKQYINDYDTPHITLVYIVKTPFLRVKEFAYITDNGHIAWKVKDGSGTISTFLMSHFLEHLEYSLGQDCLLAIEWE